MVKLLKGSVVMDLSKLRMLGDRELIAVIKELNRLSAKGYRVFVSLAPFNANILYRGRVYRMSISHGAIIISPNGFGDDVEDICKNIGEDLCWQLSEDVWADVEEISYRFSLENKYPCPKEYIDASIELGYIFLEASELPRIICIDGEKSISIDMENLRSRLLIIPIIKSGEYRNYIVERRAGFRHPLSIILGGRGVSCSELLDLELPNESTSIIKDISGNTLLYAIDSDIYVFACKPNPNELLYRLTLFYTSPAKRL
ncbi:MAG: hypothetical protein QXE01_06910 [Sulfolobales archaeon]